MKLYAQPIEAVKRARCENCRASEALRETEKKLREFEAIQIRFLLLQDLVDFRMLERYRLYRRIPDVTKRSWYAA
jgi:hypothetical protein